MLRVYKNVEKGWMHEVAHKREGASSDTLLSGIKERRDFRVTVSKRQRLCVCACVCVCARKRERKRESKLLESIRVPRAAGSLYWGTWERSIDLCMRLVHRGFALLRTYHPFSHIYTDTQTLFIVWLYKANFSPPIFQSCFTFWCTSKGTHPRHDPGEWG